MKKLDDKQIGPFKVKELMKSFYCLELLISIKIYNIFYSNLFRLIATNPLLSQHNPLPSLIVANKRKKKNKRLTILLVTRRIKREKCNFKSNEKNMTRINNGILLPILII